MSEDLEYRIGKVTLTPSDTLVVKVKAIISKDTAEKIKQEVAKIIGAKVQVWIIGSDVDLSVIAAQLQRRMRREEG